MSMARRFIPWEPDPFSEMVGEFTRWGVNVVGGCCGTTPEHIAKLYAASAWTELRGNACGKSRVKRGVRGREIMQTPQASPAA